MITYCEDGKKWEVQYGKGVQKIRTFTGPHAEQQARKFDKVVNPKKKKP
jgi:hypothetical protein